MKTKFLCVFSFLLLVTITKTLFAQEKNTANQNTQLITNVQLIDGTGKPAYKA
ncbi:MAG: hypothetical protein HQ449_08470, partial [Chitinophagaceae bacterium]|nr:hypothetical protein [Chitinophagaceae bacterium]